MKQGPPQDRRWAAAYLAAQSEFERERASMRGGEFGRTVLVTVAVWGVLWLVSGLNAAVLGFGWIAGLVVALVAPSVGRWLTGHGWRDPREVRIVEQQDERRGNFETKVRWATDREVLDDAKSRSERME